VTGSWEIRGVVMVMKFKQWSRREQAANRTPVGIEIAAGAMLIVLVAAMAAMVPVADPIARYAILVVAVGAFAAVTCDQVAITVVALVGYLTFNGFLVNHLGELSWHGMDDFLRLAALVMAIAIGLAAGEMYRLLHRIRRPHP
jgi:hypothetical protein